MKSKSILCLRSFTMPVLLATSLASHAATGPAIEIRGELSNLKRTAVMDGRYDFVFSVYDAKDGGKLLWQEPRDAVEVRGGKYQALLGSEMPLDLAPGRYWLETEVDGEAMKPRSELSLGAAARADCSVDGNLTVAGKLVAGSGTGTAIEAKGAVVIGSSYVRGFIPPDGLLVEGQVGIGTTNPQDKLSVAGGAVIGAGYAGTTLAPTNGLLVEGIVGIGAPSVFSSAKLQVHQFTQDETAVFGSADVGTSATGVLGEAGSGLGVEGRSSTGIGVFGASFTGWAGYFPDRTYIGKLGVGTTTPANPLDVSGGAVIGSGYASVNVAPADGLLVQGQVSVGSAAADDNAQVTVAGGDHPTAVLATSTQWAGNGVIGVASGVQGWGVYGVSPSGEAGHFVGDVGVTGMLYKGGGSFRIDDPIDPANKILSHSFVESPDMMNLYNGNVVLDQKGQATVTMPRWFEALNRDFRYQLTAMGQPGPNLYVAEEISGNRFKIAGGEPGMKVSWLVSGIRHDAFAEAHRIIVEQDKPAAERGHYIHPDVFGQPEEKGVDWARKPELMSQLKTKRASDSKSDARSGRNP